MPTPHVLEEDISLSAFDKWVKTWNDYLKVTMVDKYSQSRLLSLFRQFLSPEMKPQTLFHVLDIKQDAKDTADEVIAKL